MAEAKTNNQIYGHILTENLYVSSVNVKAVRLKSSHGRRLAEIRARRAKSVFHFHVDGSVAQIIWNKGRTVLTRTHYWFQHEPCWYVRKKNAPWFGKAGQNSTIWDSPSPKFIMGGSDEDKFDHPTQKPVELMRRPLLNHTKRGELVYEPFLGSGTTLAAAELTERVCYGMELDPKYVDVVVARWQQLTGKQATLQSDGRSFERIRSERVGVAA